MRWLLPAPQSNETATLQLWPVTDTTVIEALPCPLDGSLTAPVQLPWLSADSSIVASSVFVSFVRVNRSLGANPAKRTATASADAPMRTTDSLHDLSEASIGNGIASAKPAIFPSDETTAMRFASPEAACALILIGSSGPSPLQKPAPPAQTRTPRLSKLTPSMTRLGSLSGVHCQSWRGMATGNPWPTRLYQRTVPCGDFWRGPSCSTNVTPALFAPQFFASTCADAAASKAIAKSAMVTTRYVAGIGIMALNIVHCTRPAISRLQSPVASLPTNTTPTAIPNTAPPITSTP